MRLFNKQIAKLLLATSLVFFVQSIQAGVAVITHPGVKEIGLSKDKLARIYLGKLKKYSNGTKIKAVDLPNDSSAHKKFYQAVVKKSASAMNRYWSKVKYTGKGKPPKKLNSEREVLKWVASTKGAIGYIDGKYLNKSVKVVLILP